MNASVETGEDDLGGPCERARCLDQRTQRSAGPLGIADRLQQPGLAYRPWCEERPAVAGALERHLRADFREPFQIGQRQRQLFAYRAA